MRADCRRELPAWPVCRGNLKQVLTEIVVNECKSALSYGPRGKSTSPRPTMVSDNGLTLTPANGLLRADEEKVQDSGGDRPELSDHRRGPGRGHHLPLLSAQLSCGLPQRSSKSSRLT